MKKFKNASRKIYTTVVSTNLAITRFAVDAVVKGIIAYAEERGRKEIIYSDVVEYLVSIGEQQLGYPVLAMNIRGITNALTSMGYVKGRTTINGRNVNMWALPTVQTLEIIQPTGSKIRKCYTFRASQVTEALKHVEYGGATVVLTKHGKPVAQLGPYAP